MTSNEPDQDNYDPFTDAEQVYVMESISRNARVRSVSLKLAAKYREDAALFNQYANNWENQARDCSYLLHLAFNRRWALEDSGQWN